MAHFSHNLLHGPRHVTRRGSQAMVCYAQDEVKQEAAVKEASDLELARRLQEAETSSCSMDLSGGQLLPPTWDPTPGTTSCAPHMFSTEPL